MVFVGDISILNWTIIHLWMHPAEHIPNEVQIYQGLQGVKVVRTSTLESLRNRVIALCVFRWK